MNTHSKNLSVRLKNNGLQAAIALITLLASCSLAPSDQISLPEATFTVPVHVPETESLPDPTPESAINNTAVRYMDIPYASLSDAQRLDLFVPAGEGPYPLVILIHGGGFLSGDKAGKYEKERFRLLVSQGYAAATINYRLSDEAIYPAQIHDVKTAVRYLRSKADVFNLDAERFGAWGPSAGGTLASLLGTTCGVEELEGAHLGYANYSSCISVVVDWFGLVDFLAMDAQFEGTRCKTGYNDPDSAESKLVGAPIQTVPELVAKTNPMNYISNDDAAFFIQHGSRDCRVPPIQSRMLADALIKTIGEEKVFFEEIEGAGHGGDKFRSDENHQKVLNFLDRFLKKS
jgi:acetyl esterase/lipase